MSGLNPSVSPSAKAAYWQEHVSVWSSSGLSHAEYSRRHGVAAHCLRYWIKKLKARELADESAMESSSGVGLVALDLCRVSTPSDVDPEPPSARSFGGRPSPLRVLVGQGFVVEVAGDFDGAVLEKLLMILGRVS
jgi:hypothetical protein